MDFENTAAVDAFWKMTEDYFREIIDVAEGLEYFFGEEYRLAVVDVGRRKVGYRIRVACLDDAFCMYSHEEDGSAYIMEFYVPTFERKKGIGRQLYCAVERLLAEQGVDKIALTPIKKTSGEFWQKMGYTPTGEIAENDEEIFIKYIGR